MFQNSKRNLVLYISLALASISTVLLALILGLSLSLTENIRQIENFTIDSPALPTQILDMDGELITEIFEEKREIISITKIPENMIYALLTREDMKFFSHKGFSLKGILRALWNNLTKNYFSGASSITQQLAGNLYADRTQIRYTRKLEELWWAFQLERKYTKQEILELYLNKMCFGHQTYGVGAASDYFFHHSVEENTVAESVLLVIQLASPGLYSPINKRDTAQEMQRKILSQMVDHGFCSAEEAQSSFEQNWANYDWSRSNYSTAGTERLNKAPFFSEYVMQRLDEIILGKMDINRDGYVVHTTLDLDYQKLADEYVQKGLVVWNKNYKVGINRRMDYVDEKLVPIIDLLSLNFNIDDIQVAGKLEERNALDKFYTDLAPVIDLLGFSFNNDALTSLSSLAYDKNKQKKEESEVETALVTLENHTGYIKAMVGGSEYSKNSFYNRAVDGKMEPGSSFKPLYYSAAMKSRLLTPATRIYDGPTVFWSPDGSEYTPENFMGEWKGYVLLRDALANSMNVPAIKVLDAIGFDRAIETASALLGITDQEEIDRTFPRVYPLGLGVIDISPLRMARAYATLANEGRAVEPIAIRYIEDRDGRIVANPEQDLRNRQNKEDLQILTPQEAYIMVSLLQSTVAYGTLANRRRNIGGFDGMPMAGKTGTTQNWSDAWTAGFSPYMTTILWAGFDSGGSSLGVNQTGATATGPYWAQYMKKIHEDLPRIQFNKPKTGLVELTVCSISGQLPTDACDEGTRNEIFLEGTEPTEYCEIHKKEKERDDYFELKLMDNLYKNELEFGTFEIKNPLDENMDENFFDMDMELSIDGGIQTEEDSLFLLD